MTATQMLEQFLLRINESYAFQVPSWEIGTWLSEGQHELYVELSYNPGSKPALDGRPRNQYQDSLYTAEALAPFQRVRGGKSDPNGELKTDPMGFLSHPADFDSLTSLQVFTDGKCSQSVPVKMVREVELSQVLRNPFNRPAWGDFNRLHPYAPISCFETASQQGGWRLYPQQQYSVLLRYLISPPDIRPANQAWELADYAQSPSFVSTPTDVNTLFPERWHGEIVSRAVRLYSRSVPDYAAEAAETRSIQA
jgi:hypothetical protein